MLLLQNEEVPSLDWTGTQVLREELINMILFHYGANCPWKLAELLHVSSENILAWSIPAVLKNHAWIFQGDDPDYGFSVATLIYQEGTDIHSYATEINEEELKVIDEWEGDDYTQVHCEILNMKGEALPALWYDMKPLETFLYPSEKYLIDVAETL